MNYPEFSNVLCLKNTKIEEKSFQKIDLFLSSGKKSNLFPPESIKTATFYSFAPYVTSIIIMNAPNTGFCLLP